MREYLQPHTHALLGDLPDTLSRSAFDDYQNWMSETLQTQRAALLGAFMGAGKTAVGIDAFREMRGRGKVRRMLVIAPLNVARETWPDEMVGWDFTVGLTYAVAVGDEPSRLAALRAGADVTIINRENVIWLWNQLKAGAVRWDWEVVLYDEASRLKSGKQLTQGKKGEDGVRRKSLTEFGCMVRIRNRMQRISHVWEFSGTPTPKGLIDLWGPMYLLDFGKRLGQTRKDFLRRWFYEDPYSKVIEPRVGAFEQIMEAVKDIFWCLHEEDYLDVPGIHVIDRYVTLPEPILKKYRKLRREFALDDPDVEAATRAVLTNKLLQFANGSVYVEEDQEWSAGTRSRAEWIHDCKLDALESILEEAAGRPVLIAYSYRFDVDAIKKRFPFIRIFGETSHDKQDWNEGRLKGMLLHPASAAHGLNFQFGGNIAVWYGLNWSLELYLQFNKRLSRRGQEADRVLMYRILAKDTDDARVAQRLNERAADQGAIMNAVRVAPVDLLL